MGELSESYPPQSTRNSHNVCRTQQRKTGSELTTTLPGKGSQDSSVSIVTGYALDGQGSIHSKGKGSIPPLPHMYSWHIN
jgi:hypothetical protein